MSFPLAYSRTERIPRRLRKRSTSQANRTHRPRSNRRTSANSDPLRSSEAESQPRHASGGRFRTAPAQDPRLPSAPTAKPGYKSPPPATPTNRTIYCRTAALSLRHAVLESPGYALSAYTEGPPCGESPLQTTDIRGRRTRRRRRRSRPADPRPDYFRVSITAAMRSKTSSIVPTPSTEAYLRCVL